MMFMLDMAFATQLLALGLGTALLIWAYRNKGVGVAFAKAIGYIITVLALLTMLCSLYYGFKYWGKGYFKSPMASQRQMMLHTMKENPTMMENCSMAEDCPMMKDKEK